MVKPNAQGGDIYQEVESLRTSVVAQMVKRLPIMQETRVRSLGWEDALEKEMATHSSTPAWKIPNGLRSLLVHRIFQARVLEWVAISFSRASSQLRDRTQVSCIAGGFFTA